MHDLYAIDGGLNECSTGPRPQTSIEPILQNLTREVDRLQKALQARSLNAQEPSNAIRAPVSASDIDQLLRKRVQRNTQFGHELFCDPGWDILLALYSSHLWQRRESIGATTIAAGVSLTTGLRWLSKLEELGFVRLTDDQRDRRRRFAELSSAGIEAMDRYFGSANRSSLAA